MTTLVFTHKDWKHLKNRIYEEYGDRIFLISWRLDRELGFTVRTHREWLDQSGWNSTIRLDFKDPARATFFQLKYGCENVE